MGNGGSSLQIEFVLDSNKLNKYYWAAHPTIRDCALDDWSEWSDCSTTCGREGTQSRSRRCNGEYADLCSKGLYKSIIQSRENKECIYETECPFEEYSNDYYDDIPYY